MISHPHNTIKQNTFTWLNNSSSIEILFLFFHFSGYILRSETARSYRRSIFNFFEWLLFCFPLCWDQVTSPPTIRVPFFNHIFVSTCVSCLFHDSHLTDMRWCIIVALTCISLVIKWHWKHFQVHVDHWIALEKCLLISSAHYSIRFFFFE